MKTRFIAAALVLVSLWGVCAPLALSAETQAARQASRFRKHSCCPSGYSAIALPIFVSPAPAKMPCGGQSPCCAKQAPAKPALLALNHDERPALEIKPLWTSDGPPNNRIGTALISAVLSSSLFLRSTVLRI